MRFIFLLVLVFANSIYLFGQVNIDSIIKSGSFLLAEKKIQKSYEPIKTTYEVTLLTELKQYNKARSLLLKKKNRISKKTFYKLQSALDLQTSNQNNSIIDLSNELNDSTTSYEGFILFELSRQFNSIDSNLSAKHCIIKSIQLLSNSRNDTIKLDQLVLFSDILSNTGKKMEALQILNSAQVLSQSDETTLTPLKRKQYLATIELKKGIVFREIGKIEESLTSLQTCDFNIHSIDKLWALKIKSSLYQAFQITLFIKGDKDKMFAYTIKSTLNKEIIDDLMFNYFDAQNNKFLESRLEIEEQGNNQIQKKQTVKNTGRNFSKDDLINWILIGLLILTIGILTILLSKRKKENQQQLEQITERDKAFKLYQNQVLSQSTAESKKIIQEIGMLSKRQSKWSKKLGELVSDANKTKKQDLIDSIAEVAKDIESDVKIDQKKSQLNDNVRKVSNDFKQRLKKRYPQLIRSEVELCALIRLRMSNKEIAEIRNISLSSARTARYRLKKKLNIPENLDIEQVLLAI